MGCAFHDAGTDFSQIEGTGSSGVLLVGEASGEHEQREQTPFVKYAPAGSLLERTIRRMGLDRQQFSITNVIRCRPRNNWLEGNPKEYSALRHCRPNLDAAIAERRPRVIVALGGLALRELTGMAGEAQGISHLAGYVLPHTTNITVPRADAPVGFEPLQIPVIGDFHPAFLRRGKASYQGIFARILQRAMNIAAGKDSNWMWGVNPEEPSTYATLKYRTHPTVSEARAYLRALQQNGSATISYDIETHESASIDEDAREGFADTYIRLIQFASSSGDAIAFPWEGDFISVALEILHLPNPKCGHNVWLFDNKVLRAAGEREGLDLRPRGTIHDTLQMFHHWQPDLPAHLQFCAQYVSFPFPWKHLAGTDLAFYGCCDVDATLRLYTFLEAQLKKENLWGDGTLGYLGQVASVRPVLERMEERGLPVDNDARLKLDAEFDAAQRESAEELLPQFPESAKKPDPYKTFPPELKKLPESEWFQLFKENDKIDKKTGKLKAGKWYRYGQREVPEPIIGADGEPTSVLVLRWCYIPEFNPNSWQQLIEYMKAKKHPVPKSKEEDDEGNQKDTTNKKELQRLARKTGDTFYLKVIEYRELSKMRGTYIDGFAPHADGRVHTTFTFDTGIGQLSSRNPNIQNIPKHGKLARAIRKMVAATAGNILTEWDFKSCHVLTLGFLAQDANYIRCARIDMHSLMTGHYLKLWDIKKILSESDDELRARCKWLKSNPEYKHIRDSKVKHAGLGIGNGLKAKGLYERYMEYFASQKESADILRDYESVFDKVFAWQKYIQKRAHNDQFLKTEFGHIRRFYEVFRWDNKRGDWGHGDQAEEAISFWLSNIAFGHIREKLKELHHAGLDEKYGLFNNVHDSFMFHFSESLLDEHIAEVYPVLMAPSTVLKHPTIAPDGLVIDVEGSWGHNWAEMEEIPLPVPSRSSTLAPELTGTR